MLPCLAEIDRIVGSMTAIRRQMRMHSARVLRRAFWVVMLLGHAPALFDALQNAASGELNLFRLSFLSVSQAFFLLKLLDVRWLRVSLAPRAYGVAILAIALVHGDVAHRATASIAAPDAEPVTMVLTLAALALVPLVIGSLRRIVQSSSAHLRPATIRVVANAYAPTVPRIQARPRGPDPNRAPPR
jgi:hypothetical protein